MPPSHLRRFSFHHCYAIHMVASLLVTLPFYAQAETATPLPAVTIAPAILTEVGATARFNGRAVAVQRVDLRARVGGFLLERGFKEGAWVEKGQVLFRIDDAEYRAVLAQADAAVAAAEASLTLAQIEFDRQEELLKRNTGTRQNVDRTRAEADKARADVSRLTAQRDAAALNLSYTVITAPFAGQVGLTSFDVGALVGPDSGALATLVQADPIYVEFPVPERVLLETRAAIKAEGAEPLAVSLSLSDGTQFPAEGRIDFTDIEVSQATDTVLARAVFDNPDALMRDGALVSVGIKGRIGGAELTVPQQAIQRDVTGAFVLVVGDDGTVVRMPVTVSRIAQGVAVVTDGLAEGVMVITEGVNKARAGAKVDAAPAGTN
jgi:membrane fusion protein (multidrug efflux system)